VNGNAPSAHSKRRVLLLRYRCVDCMGLFSRLDRPAFLATTVQRSPEEKALVRRLDCFLLFFGCVSQVIKYLDQQNIKFETSEPSTGTLMLTSTV